MKEWRYGTVVSFSTCDLDSSLQLAIEFLFCLVLTEVLTKVSWCVLHSCNVQLH